MRECVLVEVAVARSTTEHSSNVRVGVATETYHRLHILSLHKLKLQNEAYEVLEERVEMGIGANLSKLLRVVSKFRVICPLT